VEQQSIFSFNDLFDFSSAIGSSNILSISSGSSGNIVRGRFLFGAIGREWPDILSSTSKSNLWKISFVTPTIATIIVMTTTEAATNRIALSGNENVRYRAVRRKKKISGKFFIFSWY